MLYINSVSNKTLEQEIHLHKNHIIVKSKLNQTTTDTMYNNVI